MKVYTYEDYSMPGFVNRMMDTGMDVGTVGVVVHPNIQIEMPTRLFLLNVIFWEPLFKFNIKPTVIEVYKIKYLTNTAVSKIHTQLYEKFLEQYPDTPHMEFVMALFYNVSRLHNFVRIYCGNYLPSIDSIGLVRLMENPEMKKLASVDLDSRFGTKVAETKMKEISKELDALLQDPNLKDNVLYPYAKAGILKSSQTPQMLIAYGARSDVDDTMRRHVISNSAFSGLDSPKDYATEYLSAKKAIYANTDSVAKAQYNGRKLKLTLSKLPTLYPGTCGSTMTLEYIIPSRYKHNFFEKILIDDNRSVILTPSNIDQYVDRPIKLVSPFCCRHTDGVCERCAGYGRNRLSKYLPPGIHIGAVAATNLARIISQKILSTKHLITTFSNVFKLPPDATKWLFVAEDTICWNPNLRSTLKKMVVRIPMDAISMAEDLQLDILPIAENFSRLAYMELVKDGEVQQTITLGSGSVLPFLSEQTLKYMKDYPELVAMEPDYVDVNLSNFDIKQPFCKYIIMNDDMLAYHSRVSKFLSTGIRPHTTVGGALNEFSAIVFDKSSIDFFFLEILLRAFNIVSENQYDVPIIKDMNDTRFEGIAQIITNSTLTMKLSFERLGDYLSDPAAVLYPKPIGMYGSFFGLLKG